MVDQSVVDEVMKGVDSPVDESDVSLFNDITQCSGLVCEFELDDGTVKSFEFSPTYMGLIFHLLGFILQDGHVYCDSDEKLCSPLEEGGLGLPNVDSVKGYKSMRFYLQFYNPNISDETLRTRECVYELTPVQILVVVVAFEFKCDPENGVFTCARDEKVEKRFLRNPSHVAGLRSEGQ